MATSVVNRGYRGSARSLWFVTWASSVSSAASLALALADGTLTAGRADVVLGSGRGIRTSARSPALAPVHGKWEKVEPWERHVPSVARLSGFVQKGAMPHDLNTGSSNHGTCFYVSDKYKFIGVKVPKAGGSSVLKVLKSSLCGVRFRGAFNKGAKCPNATVLDHGQFVSDDCVRTLPSREKWEKYFVFTFVRNPWARRASMLEYCNLGNWSAACGTNTCGSKCTPNHCEPFSPLIVSSNGAPFVDFVGHSESLQSDMRAILAEIGRRYVLDTGAKGIEWQNTTDETGTRVNVNGRQCASCPTSKGAATDAASYFGEAPQCWEKVRQMYAGDAETFGYTSPA